MKYINFDDERIPIGKRKVAYIKWATSKGTPLEKAKQWANKKFGFERKGKYIVRIMNARYMDYPSFIKSNFSWEDACQLDARKAESIIVFPDEYYEPFQLIPDAGGIPFELNELLQRAVWDHDCEPVKIWAKEHNYSFKVQWLFS